MTLALGDRCDAVRELQLLVAMTGTADAGAADGIFGSRTRAAVLEARRVLREYSEPLEVADEALVVRLRALPRLHVNIPRVRTPATVEGAWAALSRGYEKTFSRTANPLAVRVALAELQEEHGADLAAIWTCNLGNQDAVRPWDGPFSSLFDEREGRAHAIRAYATLDEGGEGYWRRLVEGYAGALWAFERGDAPRAAELLKALLYFSGSLEDYRRAMVDRFNALGQLGLG